jgi:ABC-type multidrug transport system fused ATPase/permease subunit
MDLVFALVYFAACVVITVHYYSRFIKEENTKAVISRELTIGVSILTLFLSNVLSFMIFMWFELVLSMFLSTDNLLWLFSPIALLLIWCFMFYVFSRLLQKIIMQFDSDTSKKISKKMTWKVFLFVVFFWMIIVVIKWILI